jgi:hypothetical protein
MQVLDFSLEVSSPERDDDMASWKDDLAAVNQRIDSLRDKVSALPTATTSKSWWANVFDWATSHRSISIVISTLFTIAVAGGAVLFSHWLDHRKEAFNRDVDSRIENVLNAPGGVNDTLKGLRDTTGRTEATLNTLQPFIQEVINHQFENVSKLSAQAISERLPAITNLLAAAKSQHVIAKPELSENLQEKLQRISSSTPSYWPAAAEFIGYRTQVPVPVPLPYSPEIIPMEILKHLKPQPPNQDCFAIHMEPDKNQRWEAPGGHWDTLVPWNDCTLRLGDIDDFNNSSAVRVARMNGNKGGIILGLVNVKIVYRGGPIIPFSVIMAYGCQFDFQVPAVPPERGQKLIAALLRSDLNEQSLKLDIPGA